MRDNFDMRHAAASASSFRRRFFLMRIVRRTLAGAFAGVAALAGALAFAPAAQADITKGVWRREDGKAHVRIAPCGSALCAINVWIRDPGDENVGDRLVLEVRPTGEGVWEGSAFDPKRNLRFSSRITYDGDRMTTSGCMLKVFCKTVAWTRTP
jgi:uncharacterized protein (DUF2147 family)